ncbi:MAG: hypothetical protein OXG27_13335 [Chloroflexi bacterium]|nr:hypothetical protein [Chloroflexota bacterium]
MTETRAARPTSAPDPQALRDELRLLRLDARLLLRDLSVTADGTVQTLWPRFSAALGAYVVAVRHDIGRVSLDAVPARLGQAVLGYTGVDGTALPDADPDAAGLQVDLPDSGSALVQIAVAYGAQSRHYRIQLIRTGPPDGVPPCADNRRNQPEFASQTFEIRAGRLTVSSTPAHYFVLYQAGDEDGPEVPLSISAGQAGATVLADALSDATAERYRVTRYRLDDPADIDGDCIDDLTELLHPTALHPLNPAPPIAHEDGVVAVPDQVTFDELSYRKDGSPEDFAYLKFILLDLETERPRVYFLNSREHRYHVTFREALGLEPSGTGMLSGTIVRHTGRVSRNGRPADFHFEFWPYTHHRFEVVARAQAVLAANMPRVRGRLAYYVPPIARQAHAVEAARYRASGLGIVFDENIAPVDGFAALNSARGFGILRVMEPGERPGPRDVVIYEAIPNELPRVAGIITTVAQTPLSHVNLRAVQDGVPNAYIMGALEWTEIADHVGRYVRYEVTPDGWTMRDASLDEVEQFYASIRPQTVQVPERDLKIRAIQPLAEIGFEDWRAFGVKAANLAVLGRLELPAGTVPDGYAVPFFFYHEFMRQNDFYRRVEELLADSEFQSDLDVQQAELSKLRNLIRDATMPRWMIDALSDLQASFPEGTSIRCRSSTNNEDLPGFSGAGLYDSRTQHPHEGHMSKCIKQVYASLWNFRAFAEREFHRVDHLRTAMAVLTHPNYSVERANGVAVSFDPLTGSDRGYYVNAQLGEDLVTNPMALSTPEEILLRPDGEHTLIASSNRLPEGARLLTPEHLTQLRSHLEVIHRTFVGLYEPGPDEPFAIEVEFKITWDNRLAIKQARPWIFPEDPDTDSTE